MGAERSRREGYGGTGLGGRVSGERVGTCEEDGCRLRGKTNTASGSRGVVGLLFGPGAMVCFVEGKLGIGRLEGHVPHECVAWFDGYRQDGKS